MIRRILHADLADVRALAREAMQRATNAFHERFYLDLHRTDGCVILGARPGGIGAGYILDSDEPDDWPDHARLLTIGRVTLAAWGGRPL